MFADTHTHLDGIEAEQIPQVIEGAKRNDVEIFIAASMNLESSRKTVRIAEDYEGVFAAVGIHPWNAVIIDQALYQSLRELTSSKKVVAISEIGLDFLRDMSGDRNLSDPAIKEIERQAFGEQIRLAREVGLPMIIHCREAYSEMMEILRREKASEIGGAIHGFSGDEVMLRDWLDLGFYISVGVRSITSLDDTPSLKETYQKIPADRLLLETDSDPSQVKVVATKLAELRGMTPEEMGELTTDNLKRLLKLPI